MAATATPITDASFLEELLAFTRDDRNDLAVRLVELHALRAENEITPEEFTARRHKLYA